MAFGMRKALQAEQSKSDMENRTIHLEGEKNDLERQIAELKAKCVSIETREGELRQLAEQKHQEDVADASDSPAGRLARHALRGQYPGRPDAGHLPEGRLRRQPHAG